MTLKDLNGKRTGRPPGSKTTSRVKRDIMWVYRNLEKSDAAPPSPGARMWAEQARKDPGHFLSCVVRVETGVENKEEGERPGREATRSLTGKGTIRIRKLFVPEGRLVACLEGESALRISNLPSDCMKIEASEVDQARGGVVFTVFSELFSEVAEGKPIPDLEPEWTHGTR
jgi:hypothetical protein